MDKRTGKCSASRLAASEALNWTTETKHLNFQDVVGGGQGGEFLERVGRTLEAFDQLGVELVFVVQGSSLSTDMERKSVSAFSELLAFSQRLVTFQAPQVERKVGPLQVRRGRGGSRGAPAGCGRPTDRDCGVPPSAQCRDGKVRMALPTRVPTRSS